MCSRGMEATGGRCVYLRRQLLPFRGGTLGRDCKAQQNGLFRYPLHEARNQTLCKLKSGTNLCD